MSFDLTSVTDARRRVRRLQRAARAGEPAAVALAARYSFPAAELPLSAAQLVVAREAGFPSWRRLRAHLDVLGGLRRDPDAVPTAGDPTDDFCRLACLVYAADDGPVRWAQAAARLAADPTLPTRSVYAAATVGDPVALAAHLTEPGAAARSGGRTGGSRCSTSCIRGCRRSRRWRRPRCCWTRAPTRTPGTPGTGWCRRSLR